MAPTLLEKATSDRAGHQATLNILSGELITNLVTPLTKEAVSSYLTMADTLKKDIIENYRLILQSAPKGTDMEEYTIEYARMLKEAVRAHSGFHGVLSSFPVPEQQAPVTPLQPIKLPPLELPKFTGQYEEWVSFKDIFTNMVHSSSRSKVEKLAILKSRLTGDAARVISSLVLTDSNYDIAWTTLCERYQNNRELYFNLMRKLFNQNTIQPNSASCMRELIDSTKEIVRQLELLSLPTQHWDATIFYLLHTKVDNATRQLWEQTLQDTEIPKLQTFYDFLEQRARALAASTYLQQSQRKMEPQRRIHSHHTNPISSCKLGCQFNHPLYKCERFRAMTLQQRMNSVVRNKLCKNCLQYNHFVDNCQSTFSCKTCSGRHHTMLHSNTDARSTPSSAPAPSSSTSIPKTTVTTAHTTTSEIETAPLATTLLRVSDKTHEIVTRGFLDAGSGISFISKNLVKRLHLPLEPCLTDVTGLQDMSVGSSNATTTFIIKPYFNSPTTYNVRAVVVSKISSNIPREVIKTDNLQHISNLKLADPDFHQPGTVDLLLGSEIFWDSLLCEKIEGKPGTPIAMNSKFGWLIAGTTCSPEIQTNLNPTNKVATFITTTSKLDFTMQRFWEDEGIPETSTHTKEEKLCEEHFASTHKRLESGRYVVALPWKQPSPTLGDSRRHALQRFISLERRFSQQQNSKLNQNHKLQQHWDSYKAFMKEYEELGHMSEVPPMENYLLSNPPYYIPHHFVLKESSSTTKLRVVFDASARTTNGVSLNDCMLVGPKLQDNILDIMLRFRTHLIAFTADLEKMYRQVLVQEDDRDKQRILWRENPSTPIKEYHLNTVTYGTASSAYLAVKCLQQLAQDESLKFPEASKIMIRDFYVDDLASGSHSRLSAKQLIKDLINLSLSGGFQLRKWTTNDTEVLQSIPTEYRETKELIPLQGNFTSVKTLGVFWNPSDDKYHFKLDLPPDSPGTYTKSKILSEISMIYDPCGWLSPATIVCKIFMQTLWKLKLNWKTPVPIEVQQRWLEIKSSLKALEKININRCVLQSHPSKLVLCGFSDASEKAMSAAIYVCSFYDDKPPSSHLLTAKTKVAPVDSLTLPRLELNASVLLSKLLKTVLNALQQSFKEVHAFTDSTITLNWIQSEPTRWKTYVRNRVQLIHENVPNAQWHHVPGVSNPADCASRGLTATELLNHTLWWTGNLDILMNIRTSPSLDDEDKTIVANEESKTEITSFITQQENPLLARFSSFRRFVRITAFLLRWLHHARINLKGDKILITTGPLKPTELEVAQRKILQLLQQQCFKHELIELRSGQQVSKKSSIISLAPFIDADGILRVGGRLKQASVPFSRRHPVLLPRSHPLTAAIIRDIHLQQFHSGALSTLATVTHQFWIVRGRDEIRRVINKCTVCYRHKASTMKQFMGDLPADRINPSRPFSKVGVDYAGPFSTKSPGRSKITFKCWLAIFICFATKSMHLEIVSSLSTDSFIAALRRFISRRGKPSDIFSDCGTNFVGANKLLKECFKFFADYNVNQAITNNCSDQGINWHFNPAGGPHFGGLWEAGVRSIKHHLSRVVGNSTLTYEEMLTLVTQIEAILNSRPLIPSSTDPNDLEALTPAHFLIGSSLTSPPEPDLTDHNPGRLDRWQFLQQQQQYFWRRWSNEYITRLQQRPKWTSYQENLKIGDMALIKEDRLPPLKWKLGRITNIHPGKDSRVRVATIKTCDGEITRPIVKLCLLPFCRD